MPAIHFIADGDNAFPDDADKRILYAHQDFTVAWLPNSTASGKPALAFRFELDDGTIILAQTTVGAFDMLVGAVEGRRERDNR